MTLAEQWREIARGIRRNGMLGTGLCYEIEYYADGEHKKAMLDTIDRDLAAIGIRAAYLDVPVNEPHYVYGTDEQRAHRLNFRIDYCEKQAQDLDTFEAVRRNAERLRTLTDAEDLA